MSAFLTIARRHGRTIGLILAILLGTTLSASIEMLQIYDRTRQCSAMDWLSNTAGAFIGAALAVVFEPRITKLVSSTGRRGAAAALLLAGCWAGAQLYPPVPLISRGHLGASWHYFASTHVSRTEVIAGAAGWFVFALALRAVWGRISSRTLALAMLAIPLHLLLAERSMSISDVLAGALGLVLWSITPDQACQGAGWLLLLAAIVLRELAPFDFRGPAHAFSWIPLGATMASDGAPQVVTILRKAFEYGAMSWLLRSGKVGYLAGGVALGIALFVMELLQCFMPGRSPEITDPLLALLMAVVLKVLDRK